MITAAIVLHVLMHEVPMLIGGAYMLYKVYRKYTAPAYVLPSDWRCPKCTCKDGSVSEHGLVTCDWCHFESH